MSYSQNQNEEKPENVEASVKVQPHSSVLPGTGLLPGSPLGFNAQPMGEIGYGI